MKFASIYIGNNCNANCEYCHREDSAIPENDQLNIPKLLDALDELNITKHLRILGGEPLLYMDDLRILISEIKKRRNGLSVNIATNGILLEKHVDELNSLGVSVTISYDGKLGQPLRGMELNISVLQKVHDLRLCTVLTKDNCDLLAMIKSINYLNQQLGKRLIFVPYLMHLTNLTNRRYSPSVDQIKQLCEDAKMVIDNFMTFHDCGLTPMPLWGVYYWTARLFHANNYQWGETHCVNHKYAKLDSQGNLIQCLYIRDVIYDKSNWLPQQAEWMDQHVPKCKQCELYNHCGGGCLKSKPKIECIATKIMLPWFKEKYGHRPFIPFS